MAVGGPAATNYALTIDLTRQAALVVSFAAGQPTAAQPNTGRALYVAQSQVFDFILSAMVRPGHRSGCRSSTRTGRRCIPSRRMPGRR